MIANIKKSSEIIVPIDKTSSFRAIKLDQYIKWLENHLKESATVTSRNKLVEISTKASKLLEKVGHIVSDKERDYIQ